MDYYPNIANRLESALTSLDGGAQETLNDLTSPLEVRLGIP